jgi:hypothetical protein
VCRTREIAHSRVARRSASLLLAVLATASTGRASAGQASLPGTGSQSGTDLQAVQDTGRRPFQHRIHDALPCRGCHGSGATHRVTLVRTARDCATCHHDPRRELACTRCHSSGSLAAERRVGLSLTLQVSDSTLMRQVVFRHAPHVDSAVGLECRSCHATTVTLARNRACESCHADHHAGRAECTTCHAVPRENAHNASVHLGCAGSGCHAATRAPTPALSRTLCLFCHTQQRDHEPGGSCALCHRIPGLTSSPGRPDTAGARRSP